MMDFLYANCYTVLLFTCRGITHSLFPEQSVSKGMHASYTYTPHQTLFIYNIVNYRCADDNYTHVYCTSIYM